MNRHSCCGHTAPSDQPGQRAHNSHPASSMWRRGGEIAGWVIPGATLILLPKCPLCVAMYVALFTGIGISFAAASVVRTTLLVVCIAALLILAVRRVFRIASRN